MALYIARRADVMEGCMVGRGGVVVEYADWFVGWAIIDKEFRPFGEGGDDHDMVVYEMQLG